MNVVTYKAFQDELQKIAGAGHAAVDIAGLGMLARPTIQKMRGKKVSDRSEHLHEIAGLGTLAAGVAHEHRKDFAEAAKKGWGAAKNLAGKLKTVHASAQPQLSDGALLLFRKQAGIFGGMGGMRAAMTDAAHMAQKGLQGGGARRLGVAGAAAAKAPARLATQVPRAIPTAAQVGGHAFKPNPSRAISIPGLTD